VPAWVTYRHPPREVMAKFGRDVRATIADLKRQGIKPILVTVL
jgi:hypothetical protein